MNRIDMHVHMVGNAASGHGCWVRVTALRAPLYGIMLRKLNLNFESLNKPSFDNQFRDRLLDFIRSSDIDAVCLLAQEAVYRNDGTLWEDAGNAFVPNEYVLELARTYKEFIPAVSIHPARPDAIEELDRCLENGAAMMKCLPNCQNINCNEAKFKPFWKRMADSKLPLLAHTGGEHTLEVINPDYANPEVLKLPLECGVNVIAAHTGTGSGPFDPDYLPVLIEMMKNYPNLYADTSALNVPTRSYGLRHCLENELLSSRIVHGSDYPVPTSSSWAWVRGLIDSDQWASLKKIKNPIELDYQTKVAMKFPANHFTRINSLLRVVKDTS